MRPRTPALKFSSPKLTDIDVEHHANSNSQTRRSAGPLEDTLANPFAPFLQEEVLVTPYRSELNKDAEFQEQLNSMLLSFVLKFHSWSTSRPAVETAAAGSKLSDDAQNIIAIEKEQGMSQFRPSFFGMPLPRDSFESRQRLLEFISRMKDALAVLTGLR
ncbi:hypothetical protein SCHPADRAFT_828187 [Schizopora paradoxa]|uniref:Uncharacterized protein n=1 Tax=Schizopora paradoxa TaxID=27342 RepID=A0A0H2RP15_9AGAM|nr:hypothetical protein SCHPADRAFT_828187 [Schizopora paradoxa]